jgi:hypothetical protein
LLKVSTNSTTSPAFPVLSDVRREFRKGRRHFGKERSAANPKARLPIFW